MKKTTCLFCGIMILILLNNCTSLLAPDPTPTPQPVFTLDELYFKEAETGQRFRSLDQCINDMADSSWKRTGYSTGGNFYKASWCTGIGARDDCEIAGGSADHRDQYAIRLDTLFYPQSYPEVFGLGLHILRVPESTGWGVSFYFSEKGKSVVSQGWGVIFKEYRDSSGAPAATVPLGDGYAYPVIKSDNVIFHQFSDLPLREDLAVYLSGPEAMRDRALSQLKALQQQVIAAINDHQVITCDLGPYRGDGIPPQCTPRPMTKEEEAEELARVQAHFAEQEQLLRENYREMYAAWMLAFPFEECWS